MIYFITQDDQFIKIGYTKGDPEKRLINLQIGNPRPLVLLKIIDGGKTTEGSIHYCFRKYHIRGEWYWYSREIRRYVMGKEPCNYKVIERNDIIDIIDKNRAKI